MNFDLQYDLSMSGLSVRNLPIEIEQAIEEEAELQRSTKTEVVLRALRAVFLPPSTAVRRNVRSFFGQMTARDFKEFQTRTEQLATIEENLWR